MLKTTTTTTTTRGKYSQNGIKTQNALTGKETTLYLKELLVSFLKRKTLYWVKLARDPISGNDHLTSSTPSSWYSLADMIVVQSLG
jgi:hypothetical protein